MIKSTIAILLFFDNHARPTAEPASAACDPSGLAGISYVDACRIQFLAVFERASNDHKLEAPFAGGLRIRSTSPNLIRVRLAA